MADAEKRVKTAMRTGVPHLIQRSIQRASHQNARLPCTLFLSDPYTYLAKGGFGVVALGALPNTIVKMVNPDMPASNRERLEEQGNPDWDYNNEIQAGKALGSNPFTPEMICYYRPCRLIMFRHAGVQLRSGAIEKPYTVGGVPKQLYKTAFGLAYLQAHLFIIKSGIICGDNHAENVMLLERGGRTFVQIIDFGLSWRLGEEVTDAQSSPGHAIATLGEVLGSDNSFDADVPTWMNLVAAMPHGNDYGKTESQLIKHLQSFGLSDIWNDSRIVHTLDARVPDPKIMLDLRGMSGAKIKNTSMARQCQFAKNIFPSGSICGIASWLYNKIRTRAVSRSMVRCKFPDMYQRHLPQASGSGIDTKDVTYSTVIRTPNAEAICLAALENLYSGTPSVRRSRWALLVDAAIANPDNSFHRL